MSLAAGRKNDEHSEAAIFRCKFQHREGNKPKMALAGEERN